MTTLLLGIFIGAVLVVFCLWCMERSADVTDEEVEAWLDWREEWARRQAVEEELRGMGRLVRGVGAAEERIPTQNGTQKYRAAGKNKKSVDREP